MAGQNTRGERREWEALRPFVLATAGSGLFMILGWLLEGPLRAHYGWAISAYVVSYMFGGYSRLKEGVGALRKGSLNIDLLMVLGALGAASLGRWGEGAILIFLFALSHLLEEYAAGRTRRAITSLVTLRPDQALVRMPDGHEVWMPSETLDSGAVVIVRPGERFPTDATVLAGRSAVDESPITGESVPVDKEPGTVVYAGTLNGNGTVTVQVTRPAAESTLARIIRLVDEAQEHKARVQRLTEWIDRYYTLLVVVVAGIAWVVPPLAVGEAWAVSFYRAMELLVVMSPCALVIATPAALLSGIAAGARQGVLFKGGVHLEVAGRIQVVAFDKTGTLTEGRPRVQTVRSISREQEAEVLRWAAAAELRSTHPLAKAIVAKARERGLSLAVPDSVTEEAGFGVTAELSGRVVRVGNRRLLSNQADGWAEGETQMLEGNGETAVIVEVDGTPLGVIGLADSIRPEALDVVQRLRRAGVRRMVMLTGDNARVAEATARRLALDEVRAGLLPGEKLEAIRELQRAYGPVAMVGDGMNDAPALAAADLGVAMGGAGNDAALESADVVLMADDLRQLPDVFRLGRRARSVVLQNLLGATLVITMLVAFTLTDRLGLPLAVVGHEGSTILVAVNGMRLLLQRGGRSDRTARGSRPQVAG